MNFWSCEELFLFLHPLCFHIRLFSSPRIVVFVNHLVHSFGLVPVVYSAALLAWSAV